MERVNRQMLDTHPGPRGDNPGLGILITVPAAALLWLAIIVTAFELFKWATTA